MAAKNLVIAETSITVLKKMLADGKLTPSQKASAARSIKERREHRKAGDAGRVRKGKAKKSRKAK